MRFCRNPAPGYWFLLDFPSRKFGVVYISAGKWFIQASNGFFGQLPGQLFMCLSWGKNNRLNVRCIYEPDVAGVKQCTAWMTRPNKWWPAT